MESSMEIAMFLSGYASGCATVGLFFMWRYLTWSNR